MKNRLFNLFIVLLLYTFIYTDTIAQEEKAQRLIKFTNVFMIPTSHQIFFTFSEGANSIKVKQDNTKPMYSPELMENAYPLSTFVQLFQGAGYLLIIRNLTIDFDNYGDISSLYFSNAQIKNVTSFNPRFYKSNLRIGDYQTIYKFEELVLRLKGELPMKSELEGSHYSSLIEDIEQSLLDAQSNLRRLNYEDRLTVT